jgi:hypothetical protein
VLRITRNRNTCATVQHGRMVNGFVPCVHLFIALSVRPLEFGLVEPDMGINPGLVPHGVVKGRSQSWCTVRAACAHNATLGRNEFLGYGLACFIYALVVGSTVLVLAALHYMRSPLCGCCRELHQCFVGSRAQGPPGRRARRNRSIYVRTCRREKRRLCTPHGTCIRVLRRK